MMIPGFYDFLNSLTSEMISDYLGEESGIEKIHYEFPVSDNMIGDIAGILEKRYVNYFMAMLCAYHEWLMMQLEAV
ncbi:MAG: hypothetical protein FWG43_05105 [Clostridiales bacterium]|nr:hypothetical protein [Clostridiales bacterium]